jgi:hypothetical protein
MGDAAPPPLTPQQQAESQALYRELLDMWESGTRQVLVTRHGDRLSIGAVARRIDILVVSADTAPSN